MEKPNLPLRLSKEPLIDAVFELRFATDVPAANVLPGIMFSKLAGVSGVETLPAAQMPQQIRSMDPQLQFAPLTRVRWKNFSILFGDQVLAIGALLPYPGWNEFKAAIVEVFGVLDGAPFVKHAERWSLKYVDLLEPIEGVAPISQLNVALRLGDTSLSGETMAVRAELPRDGFVHAVQILTSATVQLIGGAVKTGTLLEVDTIRNDHVAMAEFLKLLPQFADEIHASNKALFFECLSTDGLANLEPVYA